MAGNPDSNEVEFLRKATMMLLQQSEEEALLETLHGVSATLSTMKQIRIKEFRVALSPLPQALLTEKILKLREANVDIDFALATCLCEIMRITAPDPIYDDDKLEVVFKVIVNSFEDLSDISNKWFPLRMQNLETIAKVKLGLVMLDAKCQEQMDELFDIFLVTIREDHPAIAFHLMEEIMIDTINSLDDDDDEISIYMIESLLGSLQKTDREVHDISGNLAGSVLINCADKLKPYIRKTIESSDRSLDDYFDIVASVCDQEVTLSPMDTDE